MTGENIMNINRRKFMLTASVGASAVIGGKAIASESKGIDLRSALGVLVDATYCIGCRKCEMGCNEANKLTDLARTAFEDKSVFKEHRRPINTAYTVVNAIPNPKNESNPIYIKVQCMHCDHPACVSACIVGALQKTKEGPVTYDAWKCIGCRYCMVACPFQVPTYEYSNAFTPQVRKCTFCFDRITTENKKPGCVENCPNEALTFGKRSDLIALAHEKIQAQPDRYHNHVYGEHEIGGTSWLYLAGIDFNLTELPALNNEPIPKTTESIQHGIFKSFVPPLALYGLLGLVMYSQRRNKNEHDATNDGESK